MQEQSLDVHSLWLAIKHTFKDWLGLVRFFNGSAVLFFCTPVVLFHEQFILSVHENVACWPAV